MNCPKCGSDQQEAWLNAPILCRNCGCQWTDWQQSRIAELEAKLAEARKAECAYDPLDDSCRKTGDLRAQLALAEAALQRIEEYPEKYKSDTEMAPDSRFKEGATAALESAAAIARAYRESKK